MKKILIVDDQPELCRLLEVVLRGDDRELWCAVSGEEGIEVARRESPDLVLLDIMMPGGIDGYEVARILRADPDTADAVIVAMTAKVQAKDRVEALAAGADDYIGKPFDVLEVKRKVGEFLAR